MTIIEAHMLLACRQDRSIFPAELDDDRHWPAYATALAIIGDDDDELAYCSTDDDLDHRIAHGLRRMNSGEVSGDALIELTQRVASLVAVEVERQEEEYAYLFRGVSLN